jgi:hypothetical protein
VLYYSHTIYTLVENNIISSIFLWKVRNNMKSHVREDPKVFKIVNIFSTNLKCINTQ